MNYLKNTFFDLGPDKIRRRAAIKSATSNIVYILQHDFEVSPSDYSYIVLRRRSRNFNCCGI